MLLDAQARQRFLVSSVFFLLGVQVGVRAVGISDIYLRLGLDPLELGFISTVGVSAGILTLAAGGRLVERFGRRAVLTAGLIGTGASYLLNALVDSYLTLLLVWVLYGLCCSFIDLGANTVGSDYESASGESAMTGFHSWFSLGAALGALGVALVLDAGSSFRPGFAAAGGVLVGLGVVMLRAALPDHRLPNPEPDSSGRSRSVARVPLVLLATAVVFTCFFGDGILETFLSTFVRSSTTVLLAGLSITVFHAGSWVGRVLSARIVRRYGDRRVLVGSGLLAAAAILASIAARDSWGVTVALALVGFAISPIVPLGFSLAGRAAPGQTARAVGFVTAVGYTAFLLSPLAAGALADLTSLTWGIGIAAATTALVALFATRLPRRTRPDPEPRVERQDSVPT